MCEYTKNHLIFYTFQMGELYLYMSIKKKKKPVTLITLVPVANGSRGQKSLEASEATKIFKISSDNELTWTGFKPGSQSIPYC